MAGDNVFLDIAIKGNYIGTLEIELFDDIVPDTAHNFRCLCTGSEGKGESGKKLHFKNSPFHRIIKGFMAQGGDITRGDGEGGDSIYGLNFKDENFKKFHDQRGLLSMANEGKNTNSSQFFILFDEAPWLDKKHVVFGKIVEGLDILDKIEINGSDDDSGDPKVKITIDNCGIVGEEDFDSDN